MSQAQRRLDPKNECSLHEFTPAAQVPFCKSEELMRGDRLYIIHGDETYCLRLTKSGKLLLTK